MPLAAQEPTPAEFDWSGVVDYSKRVAVEPPKTQYELPGVTVEDHLGVPVAVVPLWHAVVTARLAFPPEDRMALKAARQRLEASLAEVERVYPLAPGGIFIQVAARRDLQVVRSASQVGPRAVRELDELAERPDLPGQADTMDLERCRL